VVEPHHQVSLGGSSVSITRLGLGCAPFGNLYSRMDDGEVTATVEAALEHGIRYFDTAPLYGHGLSEIRLGTALRSRPASDVVISSKVGRLLVPAVDGASQESIFVDTPPLAPVFDLTAGGIERSLQESLERLGIERLPIVLLHDPDDHAREARETALPLLLRLREAGLVDAVGVGMNHVELLVDLVREFPLDVVLVAGRCSLLDQGAADELLPLCDERGVSAIVGGVFNSGLLADPRPGAHYDYLPAPDHLLERARQLDTACQEFGVDLKAAALQYPFQHAAVAGVVVGARSAAEIDENARLLKAPVPPGLWSYLRSGGLLEDRLPA
jgi:D-threo-aldose 1-dehydrogenase